MKFTKPVRHLGHDEHLQVSQGWREIEYPCCVYEVYYDENCNIRGCSEDHGKEVWWTEEHFICPDCGQELDFKEKVELDHRGYAFCPKCSLIFNDGKVCEDPPKPKKGGKSERKRAKHFLKRVSC